MSTNGIGTPVQAKPMVSRRHRIVTSSLAFRLALAFIISWLIILAFFATGAISH